MALNSVTLSTKLFFIFPASLWALKEDIPPQLGDFHSQWPRWISCACTGMHGELPCYSMWFCLRSHLSTEWASPGKWKGGTHKWNCWRPRLAQRMTKALSAVWPGRAVLTPAPTTAQAHVNSQEEFKGSKAILKEQGFGQCWFKHWFPVNAGNWTWIPCDSSPSTRD